MVCHAAMLTFLPNLHFFFFFKDLVTPVGKVLVLFCFNLGSLAVQTPVLLPTSQNLL